MSRVDNVKGTYIQSDCNKMGVFIWPLSIVIKVKEDIIEIAVKAYEDWMAENFNYPCYEDYALGDYIIEMLKENGYKKDEDYALFFDSDWD